jgi:hypothetical protein
MTDRQEPVTVTTTGGHRYGGHWPGTMQPLRQNYQACACPPGTDGLGQIHNPRCSLNPSRRCTHCNGTGLEPR